MNSHVRRSAKTILWALAGLCLVVLTGAAIVSSWPRPSKAAKSEVVETESLRLVPGKVDTLALSAQLVHSMGVRTEQVQSAGSHDRLNLSGSLILDSNRLVRVHSRFAGEVVSIGSVQPGHGPGSEESRPLRLGDHVTKGQLLAVVWSKDVGEKKSDLVNALSKFYLDEAQLKSLKQLGKQVIAERQVREAEREREADIIEVDRVERTLRSWRLTEAEINVVRAEAEKIHKGDVIADMAVDKSWAEVEVRSPFEGVVLEKNIVAGDIVDTSLDLFKIADLSVLGVMANVYEEDLPALESLPSEDRRWTVFLKSQGLAPGISGTFDLIGNIVDPNQHTAAVMGWLDNKDGRLKAGQFVTAVVDLPAAAGEVVIPDTALIEEGAQSVVFVATKGDSRDGNEVTRRNVALVSRGHDVAFVRSMPNEQERAQGCQPLQPGEWVVAVGSIELNGALDSAMTTASDHQTAKH
jgi:cobalt-zinc-cadmium efflux system membrane fusion protein